MENAKQRSHLKSKAEKLIPDGYTDDPVGMPKFHFFLIFLEEAFSNRYVSGMLQTIHKPPRSKNKRPATANQEIGWYHQYYVEKYKNN